MKKVLSFLLLISFVFADFFSFLGVFASANLVMQQFWIQVNNGPRITGTTFAKPWDTLKILAWWQNMWDVATNVGMEYTFSHNQFTYVSPETIDVYQNFAPVRQNIGLSEFNPPSDNTFNMVGESQPQDYLDAYFLQLKIDKNTSQPLFNLAANFIADGFYAENKMSSDIYVDVRPHILDFYFENSSNQVTNQVQWSHAEPINFVMKIQDLNGCENIDWGTITADLSAIWAQSQEVLSYFSCEPNGHTAIFKKTWITTDAPLSTYSFAPTSFQIIDEHLNSFLLDDPNTTFDDRDKKSPVNLTIVPASAPNVQIQGISSLFVWWPTKQTLDFQILANQNGEYKIIQGADWVCSAWNVITDWTSGIVANTQFPVSIAQSTLPVGNVSLQVCVKNSWGNIGSYNLNITKDIEAPLLTNLSVSPANVILNNSTTSFMCSEDGEYELRLWWTGNGDGTFIFSGSTLASKQNSVTLQNTSLSLWDNTIHVYCRDNASNTAVKATSVKKVPPTPNMSNILSFSDTDADYQWLDGRDISVTWDNSAAAWYADFESYRIYVLPENISLNAANHKYVKLIPTKTVNSFSWDVTLKKDSQDALFVSGGKYKVCIAIMGTQWMLGGAACSAPATLTSDNVVNAKVIQAKFISDTILELTTDTTLDSNVAIHNASGISYTYNGNTQTASSVLWVSGSKMTLSIPSLGTLAASGSNLVVNTGSIRSSVWGFNNYFSNPALSITDGQNPTITGFAVTTPSVFSNFYSGSISVSATFAETMQAWGQTKIIFERNGGNAGSTKSFPITESQKLLSGNQTFSINLWEIGLTNGTYYTIKIEWKDLAGNYVLVNGTTVKYDAGAPDVAIINNQADTANPTPTLSWRASTDNTGNGSGIDTYIVNVYGAYGCSGSPVQSSSTSGLSFTPASLANGNYSFSVVAKDKLWNISAPSSCDNFIVDTTIPTISNLKITDTVLLSNTFTKVGNQVTLTAQLANTQSDKISADLSLLTGNASHTWVVCSSPVAGVSCTYVAPNLTYTFNVWFDGTVSESLRQVKLSVTTPSGVTTTTQNTSITQDSIAPTQAVIVSPTTLTYGWDVLGVTYNSITDNNLRFVKYEYSNNSGSTWNLIATGSNVGTYNWDISALTSGNTYKFRITAYDAANNQSVWESSVFSFDKVAPILTSSLFTSPVNNQFIPGNKVFPITWNAWGISDVGGLKTFPISLYYSTDNKTTWQKIASSLPNTGSYNWNVPSINASNISLKIVVTDMVSNESEQISSQTFTIDSINPALNVTIGTPPNGAFVNNGWFEIFGNVTDTNIQKVAFTLQRKSDNKYWNGASYVTGETLNTIQDNIVWPWYTFNQMIWSGAITNLVFYDFSLVVTDKAGNTTLSPVRDYVWDISWPNMTYVTQNNSYFAQNVNILWTANDFLSWVSSVKISVKKWSQYWNGNSYVPDEQLLSVNTVNNYANWSYAFSPDVNDVNAQEYEITAYGYDSSYKVNNVSSQSLTLKRDIAPPVIDNNAFTFDTSKMYLGWETLSITWTPSALSDVDAWLAANPVKLDYFDGNNWTLIADNLPNSWLYDFVLPSIDTPNMRIRITAKDLVWNTSFLNSQSFLVDSTPPTLLGVETMDMDANGQIDALYVKMSENILDSSIVLWDFSISWIGTPTSFETASSANDSDFILKFSNSGNSSTTPNLTYTKGSLRDIAGKKLENVSSLASVDKAVPRILSANSFDTDANGKVDEIRFEISENLQSTQTLNGFTLQNTLVGMSLTTADVSNNIITLWVSESLDFNTNISALTASLNNSLYVDIAWNLLGNISDFVVGDKAKPVIVDVFTKDIDTNSKLDTVEVVFSETISGVNYSDFSFTDLSIGSSYLNAGTLSDTILRLNISPTSLLYDTNVVPKLSYNGTTLSDTNGNTFDTVSTKTVRDGIAPKLVSISTKDLSNNGKIDTLRYVYSENLWGNVSGTIVWVNGYWVIVKAFSWNTLDVVLQEKEIYDTLSTPISGVSSNTTLTDLAGNLVWENTPFVASLDGVGPVIIGARYEESDHKIYLTFSENIDEDDLIWTNFVFQNAGAISVSSVNIAEKSLTVTWENIDFATSKISFLGWEVNDNFSNAQSQEIFVSITAPIIINEVMISDNSDNNYVELKNISNSLVDISWFIVAGVTLPPWSTIAGNGYFLITKTSQTTSILNVVPNVISSSLDLSSTQIILSNGVINIDSAKLDLWYINTSLPSSMERRNPPGLGTLANSWYTSIVSSWFDTMTPTGTPGAQNVEDNIAPWFVSSTPENNQLLGVKSFDFEINFEENVWGVWVDQSSIDFELSKFQSGSWSPDVLATYLVSSWMTLSPTQAKYPLQNLPSWKYKGTFTVSDKAGNELLQEIIFYVDNFEVTLNQTDFDIGTLNTLTPTYASGELILTVKTLWASFTLDHIGWEMTSWLENIPYFNWVHGWWADLDTEGNGYSGSVMNVENIRIIDRVEDINPAWEGNTFIYKMRFWAQASWESAWIYTANNKILVWVEY